jgi:hypothetical protein
LASSVSSARSTFPVLKADSAMSPAIMLYSQRVPGGKSSALPAHSFTSAFGSTACCIGFIT